MIQVNDRASPSPTNVYVVAENRLLRETLVRLFRKRGDLSVVGENSYSDSVPERIASAGSHLLLLDCLNPHHTSDDLICDLRESVPHIKVVLFGMDEDTDIFLQAVRLGVNGYVLKNASAAELIDAVRAVAQGEAVCPAKFCKVLFQTIASESSQKAAIAEQRAGMRFELTQRQRQLMSLVAMGLSNKEIAANLNLSEFTVKNHIYRVMKQVDAQNRHQAVTLIRAGGSHEDEWQGLPLR
ncbi:MAG TPA: response regulator transcription factor [Blastocatellia bacterium]